MKTLKTTIFVAIAGMLFSCSSNKKDNPEQQEQSFGEFKEGSAAQIGYDVEDTITIEGKLYKYQYSIQEVDSLPKIINSFGVEYAERMVQLKVMRDSTKVYEKKFLKSTFKEHVPSELLEHTTLVGINYNIPKRDEDTSALFFIITVGDPDETADVNFPLEIKIATDGSSIIRKAENLETGPLTNGMNIDPSDEGV